MISLTQEAFTDVNTQFLKVLDEYKRNLSKLPKNTVLPEELNIDNVPNYYMVLSSSIQRVKSSTYQFDKQLFVLKPPAYNTPFYITIETDLTDLKLNKLSHAIIKKGPAKGKPLIELNHKYVEWVYAKTIALKKFRKALSKSAPKSVNLIDLPIDVLKTLQSHLSDRDIINLRDTASYLRKNVEKPKRTYYFSANHPNFISAYLDALHKLKTHKSSEEIFAEYNSDYNTFKSKKKLSAKKKVACIDNLIRMYLTLISITPHNDKYIYDLIGLYDEKATATKSVSEAKRSEILKNELAKLYITTYLKTQIQGLTFDNFIESCSIVAEYQLEGIEEYVEESTYDALMCTYYILYYNAHISSDNIRLITRCYRDVERLYLEALHDNEANLSIITALSTIDNQRDDDEEGEGEGEGIYPQFPQPEEIEKHYQSCLKYIFDDKKYVSVFTQKGTSEALRLYE